MQRIDLARLLADQAENPPAGGRRQEGRRPVQLHPVRFQDHNRRARNLPRRSSY
ncbi:hypothetical protein HW130_06475 [Streptomyces sp. PKU-EA00015]|uniref:hypothetical protein n=1 Tax=Streptomyces sp. PKU-EA00015 TaxID=2748326 RepID=UPI00159FDF74|nr:hypothetical protein [Streptomyces sp. PKU-EA00015]NWF25914.1 hypothetical protein [Streptomyces sp. PKU-EA00015]